MNKNKRFQNVYFLFIYFQFYGIISNMNFNQKNKMDKFELKVYSIFFLFVFVVIQPFSMFAENSQYYQEQINKLKQQTAEKNKAIAEAKKKQAEYQDIIDKKREEKTTLKSQKEEIQGQILKTKFDIIEIEDQIDKTSLEMQTLDLEVMQTERSIEEQKVKIADLINVIYKNDSKGILEALFLNDSLSEFFDQIKYAESINTGLASVLDSYKQNKEDLNTKKQELKDKAIELEQSKLSLEDKKQDLQSSQENLALLIKQTEDQEDKFQSILSNQILQEKLIQAEISQINKDINSANSKFKTAKEKEAMEKKLLEMGGAVSNNSLSWPVPSKEIMSYFHDPSYPYKKSIGEHSAIDIRASQGTAIKAPAGGYVLKAKDNGYGYSYIMLMHANGIVTLYGHVSGFNVLEDQYVKTGDIIGYTGGRPGSKGAGPFTTGPHLHFEVRVNGVPVNPLEYLKIK